MSAPPTTYAAWCEILEQFAQGENGVLVQLEQGHFDWTPGAGDMLLKHVGDTYRARVDRLVHALQRDITASPATSVSLGRAIQEMRSGISAVQRLIRLPTLPSFVREHLEADFAQVLATIRRALERAVAGRASLLREIQETEIFTGKYVTDVPLPTSPALDPGPQGHSPAGRQLRSLMFSGPHRGA